MHGSIEHTLLPLCFVFLVSQTYNTPTMANAWMKPVFDVRVISFRLFAIFRVENKITKYIDMLLTRKAKRCRRGSERMVVGCLTTYAISACHY